jgi:predicted nucleic acid-binding protein
VKFVLDTNILVIGANEESPRLPQVAAYLDQLLEQGAEFCIFSQVIFEFWVVVTRPVNVNGLGLDTEVAGRKLIDILDAYLLLSETRELVTAWLELCTQRVIRGRAAHDAHLAANMISHGLTKLITYNSSDFKRFHEIECFVPV